MNKLTFHNHTLFLMNIGLLKECIDTLHIFHGELLQLTLQLLLVTLSPPILLLLCCTTRQTGSEVGVFSVKLNEKQHPRLFFLMILTWHFYAINLLL